jgi:hypothetical protein
MISLSAYWERLRFANISPILSIALASMVVRGDDVVRPSSVDR